MVEEFESVSQSVPDANVPNSVLGRLGKKAFSDCEHTTI